MSRPRICVIEDNDDFRSALVDRLIIEQFPAQGFAGIAEFLASLAQDVPDLIVSDVHMDGGDGFDLVHRLQALRLDIPVILMSGSHHPALDQRAQDMGVRTLLKKPFEFARLLDIIRQIG